MSRSLSVIKRALCGPMRSRCFCAALRRSSWSSAIRVADPFRSEAHRVVRDRRVDQIHKGAFERAIERRIGRAELAVRFFDARLERGVDDATAPGSSAATALAIGV